MVQPSAISFRTEGEPQADPSLRSRPAGCRRTSPGQPLSADEKSSLTVAVQSVFRKLDKLYTEIVPRFQHYGFRLASWRGICRRRSRNPSVSTARPSTMGRDTQISSDPVSRGR